MPTVRNLCLKYELQSNKKFIENSCRTKHCYSMKGQNPIRPPVNGEGEVLEIQEIFATIQGEGPYSGMPAVFIRLGGCNLACDFCDTEFESFTPRSVTDIIREVERFAGDIKLVVITGGEPFRQPIENLCNVLVEKGFTVQIETNGTLYRNLPEEVKIVCSPKNTGKNYPKIHPELLPHIDALKFLISADDPLYHDVPEISGFKGEIFIQPMDEDDAAKNRANMKLAVDLSLKYGYHLSIQLHKILGIP